MSEKIYEQDAYCKELWAHIIGREEKAGYVLLDRTIFFPEKGGQPSDWGTLGDAKVMDVREQEGEIRHFVDKMPSADGVFLKLNFERRFDHMQQHSGEHILSGLMYQKYGAVNRGFHLGKEVVTADFDVFLEEEALLDLEKACNEVILACKPVSSKVLTQREDLCQYPLRKETALSSDIRLVMVGDTDCVACCGTHVSHSGEVGLLKILKAEKNKNLQRIYFICGNRALLDYQKKHDLLMRLNHRFSSETEGLNEKIEGLFDQKENWHKKYLSAQQHLLNQYEEKLKKETASVLCFFAKGLDLDFMQTLHKHMGKERTLILFNESYVVAKSHQDIDLALLFSREMKAKGGKGGGKGPFYQGQLKDEETLFCLCNDLCARLKATSKA